jgi:hypothetical protein
LMFGEKRVFKGVICCKSAERSLGLSHTCMDSCWSSCAWFSLSHLGREIWSLHTLPQQLTDDFHTFCRTRNLFRIWNLFHQPLRPNGLPTGMQIQNFQTYSCHVAFFSPGQQSITCTNNGNGCACMRDFLQPVYAKLVCMRDKLKRTETTMPLSTHRWHSGCDCNGAKKMTPNRKRMNGKHHFHGTTP